MNHFWRSWWCSYWSRSRRLRFLPNQQQFERRSAKYCVGQRCRYSKYKIGLQLGFKKESAACNVWTTVFQMKCQLFISKEKCHLCAFKTRVVGHPSHSQTQLSMKNTFPVLFSTPYPSILSKIRLLLTKWSHFTDVSNGSSSLSCAQVE